MPVALRSVPSRLSWLPVLILACAVSAGAGPASAAESAGVMTDLIEARLRERLAENPLDATSWRLLGRLLLDQGNAEEALPMLQRACALDETSAAAQFDLGRGLEAAGRPEEAAMRYRHVREFSADSDYGRMAQQRLDALSADPESPPAPLRDPAIQQAGYEMRRFDGTERIEDQLPIAEEVERRFFTDYDVAVQLGAQYNSNVALTPLSRDLFPGSRDSFQALFSPDVSVDVFEAGAWRVGTVFAGDFTLNEGGFDQFNLQSYRPGAFIETDVLWGETLIVPRVDYEFGADQFAGDTFATRNQVVTSAIALWSDEQATIGYWAVDYTDFRNDGAAPFVTSRDGWTNALGATHEVTVANRWLRLVRGTVQVEHADAKGSDYRYYGLEMSAGVVCPLGWGVELECRGGWGVRNYPDFVSGPARNEHILTAGGELRRELVRGFSTAVVAGYDRFISDNARFDSERVLAGVLLIFER